MKIFLLFIFTFSSLNGYSQLYINEFSSKGSLNDNDGNNHDWVELINVSNDTINLSNYFLSDNTNNALKWQLPDAKLSPMKNLLILNSGEDRRKKASHWEAIINENSEVKYLIGINQPNSNWNNSINDSNWAVGINGVGFGDNDDSTIIANTTSLYLRYSFDVVNIDDIAKLLLHADYDDSFVAYLNGCEIARSDNIYGAPITYQTLATSSHEAGLYERYYLNKEVIDTLLFLGNNILAIEIHDVDSIADDMSSRFFLHVGIHSDTNYYSSSSSWLDETETYYHTNFKLSEGEEIIVADFSGNIIDNKIINSVDISISEGRVPDGVGNWCFFSPPNPGIANSSSFCFNGIVATPLVSLNSGWYTGQQSVTIQSPVNSHIYYTTNGDVPDTSDNLYNDTLYFDSTTVLSIRGFSNSFLPSKIVDRTYIINEDNHQLPVFSIITDSLNLWDLDSGIYVEGQNIDTVSTYCGCGCYGANFWQDWSKWSRLEFFDKNKNKQAEEEFDLEMFGGCSRSHEQKSFTLDFKSRYTGDLEFAIMSSKPHITRFNNINLRNGGSFNDKIRDALVANIALRTNNDIMSHEPCIVYLNGDYWGIYGIREKMDEHYIESNHGIDKDNPGVDLIKGRTSSPEIYSGSDAHFIDTYRILMDVNPADSFFFNIIRERFDIDNLIDYLIVETYVGNRDWIPNGANNVKLWRPKNQYGKWRFLLYDVDVSFYDSPYANTFNHCLNPSWGSKYSDLFARFLQNNDFRCEFGTRYMNLINTIFNPEHISLILDSLKDEIYDEMPRHINTWSQYPQPVSIQSWESDIDFIKFYANNRSASLISDLLPYLNSSGSIQIEFDVNPQNSGAIKINEIELIQYPWKGFFLKDLCPNSLLALADSGYVFSHWTSDQISVDQFFHDTVSISFTDSSNITANFRECKINNLYLVHDTISNSLSSIYDVGYGPYSYKWFLDNIPIALEDSSIYPINTGLYSVSITDKDGCNTISPSVYFDCNTLVETNLIQDTITNSLKISCTGGTPPYTYDWFYNNNSLVALYDSIHYPLESGFYNFLVTDTNGCQSLSDTIFTKDCGDVIHPLLIQDSLDNSLHISCNGGTQPYSYQWFLDSVAINYSDISFLDIYTYGTYFAIIEDINGCRSFTDTISSNKLEIKIFPNPTNGLINLEFTRLYGEKYTLSVFDINMNIFHNIELPIVDNNMLFTHSINLDINKNGIYLIRLKSSNNQITKRFIYIE